MVYEKLSEAELDQYLLIHCYPSIKDKINLSDRENFISYVFSKIKSLKLEAEFGENLVLFVKKTSTKESYALVAEIMCCDMKSAKMAALKTFHDEKD